VVTAVGSGRLGVLTEELPRNVGLEFIKGYMPLASGRPLYSYHITSQMRRIGSIHGPVACTMAAALRLTQCQYDWAGICSMSSKSQGQVIDCSCELQRISGAFLRLQPVGTTSSELPP
jgi:hypothetical protein